MAFDGRNYSAPTPVSPYRYHSRAPATSFALSEVLINAYVAARLNERIVFQVCYPYDHRDPAFDGSYPGGIPLRPMTYPSTNYPIRVGEGFRYIPPEATHLRAEVHFACVGSIATVASHTLSARPIGAAGATIMAQAVATPIDVSAAAAMLAATGGRFRGQSAGQLLGAFLSPFGGTNPTRFSATMELELAAQNPGVVNEVWVDCNMAAAGRAGTQYQPLAAVCEWACKG